MRTEARSRAPALRVAAALLALWACAAGAQQSPWSVGGSLLWSHDANLLRLADGQDPGPGDSRSDTVLSTAIVGGLNQNIGRQRVFGNLTLRDNRFQQNSKYNNQSYNGALGLDWSTINRVSGTLSFSAARNLSTFNAEGVGLLAEKNLESTQALAASVSVGIVTEYSLEVGASRRQVRNSAQDERVLSRDLNLDTLSVGLAWRPTAAFSLTGALRNVQALYPTFRLVTSAGTNAGTSTSNYESDRYKQQQIDLVAALQPSGASTLDLRLSFGDTRYVVNEERNFSGVNGSLGWLWQATGKLRLTTRLARDKGQDNYPSSVPFFFSRIPVTLSDSRVITTVRLQADMDVSAKVAFSTSLQHAQRTLDRNTLALSNTVSLGTRSGKDGTTVFTLGARWAPLRNALVGCDATQERRSASGDLTSNLKGATFGCYGQISLQ